MAINQVGYHANKERSEIPDASQYLGGADNDSTAGRAEVPLPTSGEYGRELGTPLDLRLSSTNGGLPCPATGEGSLCLGLTKSLYSGESYPTSRDLRAHCPLHKGSHVL